MRNKLTKLLVVYYRGQLPQQVTYLEIMDLICGKKV